MQDTNSIIEIITKDFNLSPDVFLRESSRSFLENKLKDVNTQIYNIVSKYNIASIYDFENKYKSGELDEIETFDSFKKLDRLEFQKEKILKLLKKLDY